VVILRQATPAGRVQEPETVFTLLRCIIFSGRESKLGHLRRINGIDGVSGSLPIAPKFVR
jgi:hypothetical protein